MNKKVFFLVVALIVPGLIFMFLKFFGKNEFTVLPLYQNAEASVPVECGEVHTPYFIADSLYSFLKKDHEQDSLLVIFYEHYASNIQASHTQLDRLTESFPPGSGVALNRVSAEGKFIRCGLLLPPSLDMVLVDGKKRIRGQYRSSDRDEVDRLMTELDIILKNY